VVVQATKHMEIQPASRWTATTSRAQYSRVSYPTTINSEAPAIFFKKMGSPSPLCIKVMHMAFIYLFSVEDNTIIKV
jgi:hypothetical protein